MVVLFEEREVFLDDFLELENLLLAFAPFQELRNVDPVVVRKVGDQEILRLLLFDLRLDHIDLETRVLSRQHHEFDVHSRQRVQFVEIVQIK